MQRGVARRAATKSLGGQRKSCYDESDRVAGGGSDRVHSYNESDRVAVAKSDLVAWKSLGRCKQLRLLFPCIVCPLSQPRPSAVVVVQRIWYCACPAPKAHLSARRPSVALPLGHLLRKPALPLCASALLALRVALFPPERLGITSPCKTVPSQDLAKGPLIPHQTGTLALRLRCHWQKALLTAIRRRGVRDFLRGHPLRKGGYSGLSSWA